jgi:hypothetical protein
MKQRLSIKILRISVYFYSDIIKGLKIAELATSVGGEILAAYYHDQRLETKPVRYA